MTPVGGSTNASSPSRGWRGITGGQKEWGYINPSCRAYISLPLEPGQDVDRLLPEAADEKCRRQGLGTRELTGLAWMKQDHAHLVGRCGYTSNRAWILPSCILKHIRATHLLTVINGICCYQEGKQPGSGAFDPRCRVKSIPWDGSESLQPN